MLIVIVTVITIMKIKVTGEGRKSAFTVIINFIDNNTVFIKL
jgi:hypothetical protein